MRLCTVQLELGDVIISGGTHRGFQSNGCASAAPEVAVE